MTAHLPIAWSGASIAVSTSSGDVHVDAPLHGPIPVRIDTDSGDISVEAF